MVKPTLFFSKGKILTKPQRNHHRAFKALKIKKEYESEIMPPKDEK